MLSESSLSANSSSRSSSDGSSSESRIASLSVSEKMETGPSRVEVDEETEIDVEIVEGEEGKTAGPVPAAMKG